ncbi:MAG: hypothetical protein LBF84_04030 [Holosporales bacterium]|jgi:polyhydroxyalkanoate synthase|nr:hypothetical protein [Holosporales bacterium]
MDKDIHNRLSSGSPAQEADAGKGREEAGTATKGHPASQHAQQTAANKEPSASFFAKDRRFLDPNWEENSFFQSIKEQYLTYQSNVLQFFEAADAPPADKKKTLFWVKFFLDACSPSNFPFTNPAVLQKTIAQNGENFINGIKNFWTDFIFNPYLVPPLTNTESFELGKNIATTKGSIVFQNDIFQLIQYDPVLKHTHKSPVLLIPSWINKYYLFDLSQDNSFVKFNLAQGRTVFTLSWANPTKEHCDFSMHDYLEAGINTAIDTTYKINKEHLPPDCATKDMTVNVIAMCVGGTFFLAKLAEACAADEPFPVGSVTLLMAPLDFRFLEWINLFISEPFLQNQSVGCLEKKGVLLGEIFTKIFCCLRANDLIWPNYVERYLLGNELPSLDFLYWNHDTPRIPLKMLFECINNFFFKNQFFAQKTDEFGAFLQEGLKKIKNHMFVFGTERDHVVPWESCFSAAQIFPNLKFVLGGAGHIVGCINPPHKHKYYYYENTIKKGQKAEDWRSSANKKQGSWWTTWNTWQQQFDGGEIASYMATSFLEEAPGSFAKQR